MEPEMKALFQEQHKTWEEYKKTVDSAVDKSSSEFKEKMGKFEATFAGIETKIADREKAIEANEKKMAELEARMGRTFNEPRMERKMFMPGPVGGTLYNIHRRELPGIDEARWKLIRGFDLNEDDRNVLAEQSKTLSIKDPETGGYLSQATWVDGVIKNMRELTPVLQIAKVIPITRDTAIVRRKTGTITALRRSELGSKSATTGLKFTAEQLTVGEMYAYDDVTHQDLENPDFDIAGELQEEFQEAFAAKLGSEFVSGDAVDASEGFTVNSTILAAYKASGAASAIKADSLITMLESGLTQQHRKSQVILCNRATLAAIRVLQDGSGRFIWAPGFGALPNTICGYPYQECPDMANVGAGTYPIAVGNWKSAYHMFVKVAVAIKRIDDSTLDAAGTSRFSGRMVARGFVTNPSAVKIYKIAAS